jgi:hypothetical protein
MNYLEGSDEEDMRQAGTYILLSSSSLYPGTYFTIIRLLSQRLSYNFLTIGKFNPNES